MSTTVHFTGMTAVSICRIASLLPTIVAAGHERQARSIVDAAQHATLDASSVYLRHPLRTLCEHILRCSFPAEPSLAELAAICIDPYIPVYMRDAIAHVCDAIQDAPHD